MTLSDYWYEVLYRGPRCEVMMGILVLQSTNHPTILWFLQLRMGGFFDGAGRGVARSSAPYRATGR